MALIKCPECNKEISDSIEKCIHCGYQIKKDKCPECKQEIEKDERVCHNCGYPLEKKENNNNISNIPKEKQKIFDKSMFKMSKLNKNEIKEAQKNAKIVLIVCALLILIAFILRIIEFSETGR